MAGFFKKIFGGKSKSENSVEALVRETMSDLIDKAGFDLSFDVSSSTDEKNEPQITIEISGADEALLTDREGQTIDAIQLFVKRVVQHHFAEDRTNIVIDSNGYREESRQALVDLADKLKGIALEKGRSVYIRALPPRDRKIVHQHLATDSRVKSRSVGDGLYKKIKIYPVKSTGAGNVDERSTN